MASLVAEIEKAVQNKYLSEELNIETKLHHLSLNPQNRVESELKNPEEERNKENQAALKRNKDLLKETDLVVARYRSRSLYSPVDGHLQACKLTYLKRLKEQKHREQVRRFQTPPQLTSLSNLGVPEQSCTEAETTRAPGLSGILKNSSKPHAYLVADTPIPFPRTTFESARKLVNHAEEPRNKDRGAQSAPASAGPFKSSCEPLAGGLKGRYREVRSTPGSAGASTGTAAVTRGTHGASRESAGTEAQGQGSLRQLVSKPV